MDKTLKLKILDFEKALITLENILNDFDEENEIIRDATIKRFEYTLELGWKLWKIILEKDFMEIVISPKKVFLSLGKNNFIKTEDVEIFLEMIKNRNLTSHTYDSNFVIELYSEIKKYWKVFRKYSDKINLKK